MGSIGSDPVMLELFQAELDQHLPVLYEGLLALEKGRAAREVIESMMRAAHSIKGASRVMGVDPVASVAHALEDCFTAAKDARITLAPDAVDVLLAGVDAIQRICSAEPGDAADESVLAALLARITAVGEGAAAPRSPQADRPSSAVRPSAALPTAEGGSGGPPIASPVEGEALLLPADLDGDAAEGLRCRLLGAIGERLGRSPAAPARPGTRLHLDFSSVERLGPEALAVLLLLDPERSAASMDIQVAACGVGPGVRALFRVTGLDGVLVVVD